jgi:hypothetical protein
VDEVRKLVPETETLLTPVKDSNNKSCFRDLLAVDKLLAELYQSAENQSKKSVS